MPRRTFVVSAGLLAVLVAGCGSRESASTPTALPPGDTTAATASTPPSPSAATPTTPAKTPRPRKHDTIPANGSQDFSAPVAARGDHVSHVSAKDGLSLTSAPGAAPYWVARALDNDGAFCVFVHGKGVTDPDPLCESGTQLAAEFFTDQSAGHALADVDQIARSKTSKPTELVVAGLAAPDVNAVVIVDGGRRHVAQLTGQGVRLEVDKQLARQILDPTPKQLASLPSTVTVRLFAVAFPASRHPPTTATPRSPTPVHGRMTFDLS